jgi:hypothetical protein
MFCLRLHAPLSASSCKVWSACGSAALPPPVNFKSILPMKLSRSVVRFPRRSTLRDLYLFGLVSVFRRHSIFRLWESGSWEVEDR